MPHLRRSEQRVAQFILDAPEQTVYSSITEIASEARCSDATVIRLCRALGFNGFQELKLALSRELVMPERYLHQDIQPEDTLDVAVQKTYASNMRALEDTLASLDIEALTGLIHAIRAARRIYLFGAGTSALPAIDARYKLMRIGIEAVAFTDLHLRSIASLFPTREDVVISFSHSGSTRDVVEATAAAKRQGATVAIVTNRRRSPLAQHADLVLVTAADETPFGSGGVPTVIAQLSVVDALFVGLSLADYHRSVRWLEKTAASVQDTKY